MMASKEELHAWVENAEKWVCPDCGSKLVACSAKAEVHESHSFKDRARKCVKCSFICVTQYDWGAADEETGFEEINSGYPDEPMYNEGSGTCGEREAQKQKRNI